MLEFLATKPRLTYLARVRNPNPLMPDYREWPLSLKEYSEKNGDPFEHTGAEGAHPPGTPGHEPAKGGHE